MTLAIFGNTMKFLNIMAAFFNIHSSVQRTMANATVAVLILSVMAVASNAGAAEPEVASVATAERRAPVVVGEVSLVLGKAWLESPAAGRRAAEPGALVQVEDRIVTGANGHVHIHFTDGALVSVRPDSRLEVDRYDYDSRAPERSTVRFTLEEGVTRAISGDAARSAKERFRLNTPIAAIGVRGTDFVVSATESTTRAMVNEGIIVLAPYSIDCSADSFGPCMANAVELSGESLQMLALDSSAPAPRLLPAPNVRNPDMMREEVQQAIAANGPAAAQPADEAGERSAADADADVAVASNSGTRAAELEVVQEAITTPQLTSDVGLAADAEAAVTGPAEFTPDTALSFASLNSRELLWGRFSQFGSDDIPEELERITVSFAEASRNREATVGNFDYGLFRRDLNNAGLQVDPQVLSFRLSSAQAFYNSASGVMSMDVTGGSLDVDLIENNFATQLNLDSAATGQIDFNAAGRVLDGGFFNARSADQRIAGAISLDGREAGYFFERQLEDGGIEGLTLWDSQ
ncbi:MAG: hypothetical protein PsegKO_00560 [Pseudohongiellaceae bacterium]